MNETTRKQKCIVAPKRLASRFIEHLNATVVSLLSAHRAHSEEYHDTYFLVENNEGSRAHFTASKMSFQMPNVHHHSSLVTSDSSGRLWQVKI